MPEMNKWADKSLDNDILLGMIASKMNMNLEKMIIFWEINENISTTYLNKYLRKYKAFTYF